jgi:hypothetical protein
LDTDKFRIIDLPMEIRDRIKREIEPYSTSIIYFKEDNKGIPFGLLGSGSLIQVGNEFGILTAYHVISSRYYKDSPLIGFSLKDSPHNYTIERTHLSECIVGKPARSKDYPDLAVILLPKKNIGWFLANKSFWNVLRFSDKIIENPNDFRKGVWVLSGCPDEYTKSKYLVGDFSELKKFQNIIGLAGIESEWEEENFDYLEYVASYDAKSESPMSFCGTSGGGLWQVFIKKENNSFDIVGRPILSGVAFYQSERFNEMRRILCHGRKSIYKMVRDKLNR